MLATASSTTCRCRILAVSTQGAASRLELAAGSPAAQVAWQAVISAAWSQSARAILSEALDERCDAVGSCANGRRKGAWLQTAQARAAATNAGSGIVKVKTC